MKMLIRNVYAVVFLLVFVSHCFGEYFCRSCSKGFTNRADVEWVGNSHCICKNCYGQLVWDKSKLQDYKKCIQSYFKKIGMPVGNVKIECCSDKTMQYYLKKEGGIAEKKFWTNGLFIVNDDGEKICILYPLPLKHVLFILAHEMTHLWQCKTGDLWKKPDAELDSYADDIAQKFINSLGFDDDTKSYNRIADIDSWEDRTLEENIKLFKTKK